MSSYSISKFKETWRESYNYFIEKNFGKTSYQSSEKYINWLYFENPYGKGFADFILILEDENKVVGCVHKIRFNIFDKKQDKNISCASIHNLMVDDEHRNGVGFLLVREFLKTEQAFFIPGVTGKLSESYRKLGGKAISSYWGSKIQLPNVFQLAKRLLGIKLTKQMVHSKFKSLGLKDVSITLDYDSELVSIINECSENLSFTEDFVRWRLYPSDDLKTIAVWSLSKKSCVLMVIGKRKGLTVGRIFFSYFGDPTEGVALIASALRLLKALGCPIVLITSGDSHINEIADKLKIKKKGVAPDTYYYSRTTSIGSNAGWPIISDLGFEERFSEG